MRKLCLLVAAAALAASAADKITAGNGLLYVGGRPNKIFIVDEATEKVIGNIECKSTPVSLTLSHDRKRFYASDPSFENMEIIDIASRKSIDTFKLSEGNKKMRIVGYEPDPLDRFLVLAVKPVTKQADRFEIGDPVLYQYDLKDHKIARTIPWPNGEQREFGVGLRFSPDGKLLYFLGEDIVAYDTTDFKQVDKWEVSRPIEDGFGRINFGLGSDVNEDPGFYTGIFNVQDAVQHRAIMGIARVNLAKKDVDFYPLGPASGVGSFSLAPGRKMGYGLHSEIGKYEFWSFDLASRKLGPHMEFKGRPRMGLKVSSNGKVLYIHVAGNTIDLYDAATFQYLRTISLDADMTTGLYVMPGR